MFKNYVLYKGIHFFIGLDVCSISQNKLYKEFNNSISLLLSHKFVKPSTCSNTFNQDDVEI